MATRFRIRRKVMTIISALCAVAGLFTILALYIPPRTLWVLALPGYAYFIFLFVNLFFLAYWFYFHKPNCWIPLSVLIISFIYLPQNFSIHLTTPSKKPNELKIMSWNVKCFDLYNWTNNKVTGEIMMNLIKRENPDILCLQEFYTDKKNLNNLEFIQHDLGYKYVHFEKTYTLRNSEQWGVVTFSRFPIVGMRRIPFEVNSGNACIRTTIKIQDSIYQVFNAHLQSLHFGVKDYQYIQHIKEDLDLSQWDKTKSILAKFKKGYYERANQSQVITDSIESSLGTKLVMGDFNDIPMSYAYHTIGNGLNDAYVQAGNGFTPTINMYLPNLRIDFIFADTRLQCNSYKRIKKELSDHYPIIATFSKE
jgi:endonuclease/exonuclease/phosphatase family metal-dependent hydrolase